MYEDWSRGIRTASKTIIELRKSQIEKAQAVVTALSVQAKYDALHR